VDTNHATLATQQQPPAAAHAQPQLHTQSQSLSSADIEREVDERVRKLRSADEERLLSKQSTAEQIEKELKMENKRLNELLQQRAEQV
jgi:hypothetical protein